MEDVLSHVAESTLQQRDFIMVEVIACVARRYRGLPDAFARKYGVARWIYSFDDGGRLKLAGRPDYVPFGKGRLLSYGFVVISFERSEYMESVAINNQWYAEVKIIRKPYMFAVKYSPVSTKVKSSVRFIGGKTNIACAKACEELIVRACAGRPIHAAINAAIRVVREAYCK